MIPNLKLIDIEVPVERSPPRGFRFVTILRFNGCPAGTSYRGANLKVVESIALFGVERWHHLSVSKPNKLPTWEELNRVKVAFFGPDREAIQVLAKESDHVNLHPYCLHLWAEVEQFHRPCGCHDANPWSCGIEAGDIAHLCGCGCHDQEGR